MYLQNPFPSEVRNLYLYIHYCCLCGSNVMLELHHILGRVSDSAFNSAVLCKECHDHIGHSREEHQRIFARSFPLLNSLGFRPADKDLNFLHHYWDELMSQQTVDWLRVKGMVIS